jgi:hypothetical protein
MNKKLLKTIIREAIEEISEEAPAGWEGTVKAMKKHKDVDNPWALSHWMKNKGYKSHKESVEVSAINEILNTYDDLAKLVKSLPAAEVKKITDISKTKGLSAYDAIVEYLRQLANSGVTTNKKHVISKPVKKVETGEWVVKWMTNGKRDENKTYYTNDEKDAWDTYNQMVKNAATSK